MNILLFGANGQVGWELQRSLAPLGAVTALGHAQGNLEAPLRDLILRLQPQVIVNAAAYTAVDKAESEPDRAMRVNGEAVGEMAQAATELGALLVHYSTDYVFDGEKTAPYEVDDPTGPLSAYGHSKLAGETAIRAVAGCRHLIFRTSWVYAVRGKNFAHTMLQRARTMDRLQVVADTFGVPTSAELLADVTALAVHRAAPAATPATAGTTQTAPANDNLLGTYHLVPSGETTWHGYASYLIETARAHGLPMQVAADAIVPVPASTFPAPARRPLNSRLNNRLLEQRLGLQLPDWRLHVRRFVEEIAG
jgi:dTDP-4-dehydrorhamnose reductase